jgi:hypothetical protein
VTNSVYFQVKTKESGYAWNGRYGFAEYSTGTGKLVRILGYWKVKPAGYWFTQVLWSSPSGRVLIGIIPDGRMGVINGNEFTPAEHAAGARRHHGHRPRRRVRRLVRIGA